MNLGLLEFSGNQASNPIVFLGRVLEGIESKVGFLILGIRAMAFEALVRQDRSDLLVEINCSHERSMAKHQDADCASKKHS